MDSGRNYLGYVDGMRALAVLLVLCFHLNTSWCAGGYIGVDIFFVISGFLITRLIVDELKSTGRFDIRNFYYRRIKRLFPALFAVLIFTLGLGILFFAPSQLRALGRATAAAALSFSNILFWRESGYFNATASSKPLLHTWSLGVEEQFYLIWPLILWFMMRQSYARRLPFVIALCGLVSLAGNFYLQKNYMSALYFLMPFRIFEFCIGALIVWFIRYRLKDIVLYDVLFLTGLGCIVFAASTFTKNTLFPSYNALIPTLGAALILWSGRDTRLHAVLNNRGMIRLGLISYSLYLVHWPLIVFYSNYVAHDVGTTSERILLAGAMICLALLLYHGIEQPFRNYRAQNPIQQRQFLQRWICGGGVLAVIGGLLFFSQGMPWRVPYLSGPQFSPQEMAKDFHKAHFGGQGYPYPFGWTYSTDEKNPDIVLLGDSHAQMLQKGLANEIGESLHKSIYMAGSSCLILPGLSRTTPGDDWDTICPHVLKQALAQLNKKPDSVLIVSHYWLYQLLQARDMAEHQIWHFNLDTMQPSTFDPLWRKLTELRQQIGNHRMILIGDVPGAGLKDPYACLTRPTWSRSHCLHHLKPTNQTVRRTQYFNQLLADYAQRMPNTYFLDPFPVFCKQQKCEIMSKTGELFYSDDNHLSETGSRYLIAKLKTKLATWID
ncbi:MAG: hypothetical protein BGO90_12535 [Legionella sp. 40-6]|nr:acyltransferase [Legionella sp.]OJY16231.1 MAG: hypothetical protein BGO90_12535 [Legionella sp. 40-6]